MITCNCRQLSAKNKKKRRDRIRSGFLLFVMLVVSTFLVHAQTNDLTEKITLSLRQSNAQKLIEGTDRQSKYAFMFAPEELGKIAIDRIEIKGMPLGELLALLQKKYGLIFSIAGENISVKAGALPDPPKTTGKVTGVVLDEENGQPVTGATIQVGNYTVAANLNGEYTLNLPKGNYEAQVSAAGYGKKLVTDIQLKEGQSVELSISLKRQKGQLADVVITASARKESVASLLLRQKNAAAISDGISSEQIARTPDKNIADVLKRVNGVATVDNKYVVVRGLGERYNGAMLNGQLMPSTELNRKQFSFDIIPSNLVDNVVVYKTLTPDVNAEFGGGLVSVNTRAIPSHDFLTITAGAGYDDKTTNKNFTGLKIEDKQYWGRIPDHRQLMGKSNWNSRKEILAAFDHAKFPNNWALYTYQPKPAQNYLLSGGKVIELKNDHRIGLTASVSYRNTWQTQDVFMTRNGFETGYNGHRFGFTNNIGMLAGAGYQHKQNKVSWQILYLSTLDQQLVFGIGRQVDVGKEAVGYYDLFTHTGLWQHQLKGEHALGTKGIKLSWVGSYMNVDKQRPGNHIFFGQYNGDGKDNPLNAVDFSVNEPKSDLTDGALQSWSRAKEKNYNWNTELAIPVRLDIGNVQTANIIKTGYAGWAKDRFFWVVNTSSGYNTGEFQPLTNYFDSTLHQGAQHLSIDEFGDDMRKKASLHAGYLMIDHKIAKRWRLVWGVRAEYYDINKVNQVLDTIFANINQGRGGNNQFDYSDLKNREPNLNFFPSANLTYNLSSKMNLRLAYAKSIIRPDLRETSYFREYDFELGGSYYSRSPVRSTVIHHYDLRYEWYPAAGEVVSLSLFYKKLNYPMEIFKMGANREYELRNNRSAKNKGLEVEMRKTFAFTKVPVLKNITLFGNFTFIDAGVVPMSVDYNTIDPNNPNKIKVVEKYGEEEKRPQSGASNYMVNAGIGYDAKWFSLSSSYNYVSNRMFRPELNYWESLFEKPLTGLDAQLAVNLLKQKMQVRLTAGNLLGSKSIIYRNFYTDGDISNGRKAPSTNDLLYQKDKDQVDYSATPGRTYSLQLSYRF